MSFLYEMIGRLVVAVVRARYRHQLRAAAVVLAALGALAAYLLASQEVDEA